MKREVPEERLQDYVDGRLSAEGRAEIEALLHDDPEQARRVEQWGEIGRVLRESPEELSPGFYRRARERFERTTRQRGFRGFRVLSWEAVGLAAAVLLAAVLFVPEVMHQRDDGGLPSTLAQRQAPEASADRPTPRRDAMGKSEQIPDAPDDAVAESEFAPVPDEEPTGVGPAPTASPRAPTEKGRGAAREADRPQPEPGVVEYRESAAAPPSSKKRLSEAGEPSAAPFADAELRGAWAPRPLEIETVVLPAEAPLFDGIRVVDSGLDWEAWLRGPAGPAVRRLGEPDESRRLVILGRKSGVDCPSLSVWEERGTYVVRVAAGDAPGCAFLLPRDGMTVRSGPAAAE